METPVFKLVFSHASLEAASMPPERFADLMEKNDQIHRDLGIRTLLWGTIWSEERHQVYAAEWYPSWKAVLEQNRCLDALHWFQYFNAEVFLGVADERSPMRLEPLDLDPNVDWISLIYVSRILPAAFDATEAEEAEFMNAAKQEETLGGHDLLHLNTRPFGETWSHWGIELYPSMEAILQMNAIQEKARWWKYIEARRLLGTVEEGDLIHK